MATTQTVLHGKDTATQGELYMSLELGDRSWKVTISDGRRGPSRYSVEAGDTAAVLDCVAKARARCGVSAEAMVHSCYEAGRDGWWLHRWLIGHKRSFKEPPLKRPFEYTNEGPYGSLPRAGEDLACPMPTGRQFKSPSPEIPRRFN